MSPTARRCPQRTCTRGGWPTAQSAEAIPGRGGRNGRRLCTPRNGPPPNTGRLCNGRKPAPPSWGRMRCRGRPRGNVARPGNGRRPLAPPPTPNSGARAPGTAAPRRARQAQEPSVGLAAAQRTTHALRARQAPRGAEGHVAALLAEARGYTGRALPEGPGPAGAGRAAAVVDRNERPRPAEAGRPAGRRDPLRGGSDRASPTTPAHRGKRADAADALSR
mmetsp:Transcript_34678/g.107790  ORF Transcript_34678/g.107790 Transcript_34678/m.107790 type:complete len:220 (-) Transcript_34678:87-746(-)